MARVVQRTGIDILDIDRLNQIAPEIRERFLKRVFTGKELEQANNSDRSLSGLFCAKEAVSKALGCGIGKISWQEIEILADEHGAPQVVLHGNAARLTREIGLENWAISISHTKDLACASVFAIGILTENEDTLG